MKLMHVESGQILSQNLKVADTFYSRLKGLMFVKEMKDMDGLIIEPCNSIHNCFVRFPIDVLFVDSDWKIVKVLKHFKPWRFSWLYLKAKRVVEFPDKTLPDFIKKGDQLEVRDV